MPNPCSPTRMVRNVLIRTCVLRLQAAKEISDGCAQALHDHGRGYRPPHQPNAASTARFRLPEERRATLAVFCYSRSHLYDVALAIAATCDERTLVLAGGRPGTFLFEQSRHSPTSGQSQPGAQRVKISLPTNVSRQILDEELKAAIN